jgi:hypothetical protein
MLWIESEKTSVGAEGSPSIISRVFSILGAVFDSSWFDFLLHYVRGGLAIAAPRPERHPAGVVVRGHNPEVLELLVPRQVDVDRDDLRLRQHVLVPCLGDGRFEDDGKSLGQLRVLPSLPRRASRSSRARSAWSSSRRGDRHTPRSGTAPRRTRPGRSPRPALGWR